MTHQEVRKKLWCDAYVMKIRSSAVSSTVTCENYANAALRAFDEKFPEPKPGTPALPTTERR